MRKLWLIARREYVGCWKTKSFVLLTLGLPVAVILVVGIALVVSHRGPATVGYLDRAGVIKNSAVVVTTPSGESVGPDKDKVRFRAFSDTAEGQAALSREEIEVLFVLPADYRSSGRVEAYYWNRRPSGTVVEQSELMLRANLASGQSPEVQARLLEGASVTTMTSLDGHTRPGGSPFGAVLIPAVLAAFSIFSLMTATSYLLRAVSEEKENRTVELMATSVSANQLMGGKTAGLIAAALTQLVIWVAVAAVGLVVASRFVPFLGEVELNGSFAALTVLYLVPSFILGAGLVVAIGAAVSDFQQGEQISGVLSVLFLLPIFFVALLFENPDSPILVFLTLFPTSSFATVAFRWGATVIPFWQLAASWLLLVGTTAATVAVAPRIFRRGMLRYGKPMSLRGLLDAARSSGV